MRSSTDQTTPNTTHGRTKKERRNPAANGPSGKVAKNCWRCCYRRKAGQQGLPIRQALRPPDSQGASLKPNGLSITSHTSQSKSGPSGLRSRSTALNPKGETYDAGSVTTIRAEAKKMHRHKHCTTKRRERQPKKAGVKIITVLTKAGSARQSGRDNRDQQRRNAIPNARHDSKLRPPSLLSDPMKFYTRTPPAARQETPASASYVEHDYDNRGVPYRYIRYNHNHANKLKPGGNRGSGRRRNT